jgi:preprotein translocase subunit YajC
MLTTVHDHMSLAHLLVIAPQEATSGSAAPAGAQAPALVGGAQPATTGQTADGSGGTPPAAAQGPDLMIFLIPVVIFFIFITFMSSRREKKRRQQLQKVSKHDRVRTRGGIIGSVVDASDDQLVIKVDEGRDTRITLDRQYIDAILDGTGNS